MTSNDSIQWLEKNQSNLKWSLSGPNIQDPFDAGLNVSKLEEYSLDRGELLSACQVKVFMDDAIILTIKDLNTFSISTEHPYLRDLTSDDLRYYVETSGIDKMLQSEVRQIQQACKDEMKNRQSGGSRYSN